MDDNQKAMVKKGIISIGILLFFACMYHLKDKLENIWIIIYVFLLFCICLCDYKFLKIIIDRIKERQAVISLLTTICLGTLVTVVLENQTNQIAERQASIANRETAPAFHLEVYEQEEDEGYKLVNEKGMASYVTLQVCERYSFNYKGESYEVNLSFFNEEQNGGMDVNELEEELIFILESDGFDKENVFQIVKNHIENRFDGTVYVSNSRDLWLSFFDYKNERFKFLFNESDRKIRLISTNEKRYPPIHNITLYYMEGMNLEMEIQDAIDFVINNE